MGGGRSRHLRHRLPRHHNVRATDIRQPAIATSAALAASVADEAASPRGRCSPARQGAGTVSGTAGAKEPNTGDATVAGNSSKVRTGTWAGFNQTSARNRHPPETSRDGIARSPLVKAEVIGEAINDQRSGQRRRLSPLPEQDRDLRWTGPAERSLNTERRDEATFRYLVLCQRGEQKTSARLLVRWQTPTPPRPPCRFSLPRLVRESADPPRYCRRQGEQELRIYRSSGAFLRHSDGNRGDSGDGDISQPCRDRRPPGWRQVAAQGRRNRDRQGASASSGHHR